MEIKDNKMGNGLLRGDFFAAFLDIVASSSDIVASFWDFVAKNCAFLWSEVLKEGILSGFVRSNADNAERYPERMEGTRGKEGGRMAVGIVMVVEQGKGQKEREPCVMRGSREKRRRPTLPPWQYHRRDRA